MLENSGSRFFTTGIITKLVSYSLNILCPTLPFPFLGGEILFFLVTLGGDLDLRGGTGDLERLGGEGDWCLSGEYLLLG